VGTSSRVSPASAADGLPDRIAAVRQKLGLAQRPFAARIGISRNAVIRCEGRHGRPRVDTLERIAQLGGVSVDWLLRGGRRPPEGPREWDDAVRWLRLAWQEPNHGAGRPTRGAVQCLII
jgi:transcriptional regulator with XRE-family HTH domain